MAGGISESQLWNTWKQATKRMVPVKVGKAKKGDRVYFSMGIGRVQGQCLTDVSGDAIALLTDKGNWYLLGEDRGGEDRGTESRSTTRVLEYRRVDVKKKEIAGYVGFANLGSEYPLGRSTVKIWRFKKIPESPSFTNLVEFAVLNTSPVVSYNSMIVRERKIQYWFGRNIGAIYVRLIASTFIRKLVFNSASSLLEEDSFHNLSVEFLEYSDDYNYYYNNVAQSPITRVVKYFDSENQLKLAAVLTTSDETDASTQGVFIWNLGDAANPTFPTNVCCYFGRAFGRTDTTARDRPVDMYGVRGGIVFDFIYFKIFVKDEYLKFAQGKKLLQADLIFSSDTPPTFIWYQEPGVPQNLVKSDLTIGNMPPPIDTRSPYLLKPSPLQPYFYQNFLSNTPKNLFLPISNKDIAGDARIFR
ncbi:hypothetical protein WA1_18830 [Scytonema hofmannii PCC 7110]|uniref:Uncharacterized protein n=1 Tax=Scytonema hofmannii PCC 7110 TaxID=128403 RepID=A0A139XBH0_9CYAN|nr:hypothetical protein [Scytonema hofmannii]KYC42058.1 hypothetical protein WA1_18830 [Scytonema hofmannii PCC 7110]